MLLRRFAPKARTPALFASLNASSRSGLRLQSSATDGDAAPSSQPTLRELSYDEMWSHWNEGKLFTLSLPQLQSFLTKAGNSVDPKAKKAALVRQVEEMLQKNDDREQGVATRITEDEERQKYGKWEAPTVKSETLLDITQSGFYELGARTMVPKAFQLLVGGSSPDLVVSRVNTTSFPSFPASAECYTLIPADSHLSARARYSKALQWCVMNLRNLDMKSEVNISFGKLLLDAPLVRKGRHVVSAYTLQQRMQSAPGSKEPSPYHWVTCVPEASVSSSIEPLLESEGFAAVGKTRVAYTAKVDRANSEIEVDLSGDGSVAAINEPWTLVQNTHQVAEDGGADARLTIRTRTPLPRRDTDALRTSKIVDLSGDDVKAALPSNLGKVTYVSENDIRTWEKVGSSGVTIRVTETRRNPLIGSSTADEGERTELEVNVIVPSASDRVDLNAMSNELFDFSGRISDALKESFVAAYGTIPAPVELHKE